MGELLGPLVTVITPTFNHREYIGKCLLSVLAQTEPRWEQLVIDDGSTDGTDDVVKTFGDPRISLVRRDHRGIMHLADSYNDALAVARGEFVAVLEGDDFWPPWKLTRQLRSFHDPAVVLSWGRAAETDTDGRVMRLIPRRRAVARMARASRGATMRALLEGNVIPSCTVVCRRSALERIGGFRQPDGIPTVDLPTWLELGRIGAMAPSETVLGYYRRHPAQVTEQMKTEMLRTVAWGTRFVEALPADERISLAMSVAAARRIERRNCAATDLLAGRRVACGGARSEATALLWRAACHGNARTRLCAIAALACTCSPVGMERCEIWLEAGRSLVHARRGQSKRRRAGGAAGAGTTQAGSSGRAAI